MRAVATLLLLIAASFSLHADAFSLGNFFDDDDDDGLSISIPDFLPGPLPFECNCKCCLCNPFSCELDDDIFDDIFPDICNCKCCWCNLSVKDCVSIDDLKPKGLQEWWERHKDDAVALVKKGLEFVDAVKGTVSDVITDTVDGVGNFWDTTVGQAWESAVDTVQEKVIEPIREKGAQAVEVVKSAGAFINEKVTGLQDELQEKITALDRQVDGWVESLPEPAKTILRPVTLIGDVASVTVDAFWIDADQPLKDLFDDVTSSLGIASDVVSSVRAAIKEAQQLGSELIPFDIDCPGCQSFVTNKWEKIKKEHVKRCGSEEDVGYNKNRTCQILHKSSTELNSFDVALEGAMGCAACTVGCGGCAVVAIQQYLLTYLIDTSISLIEQLAEAAQELFVEELEIAIQAAVAAIFGGGETSFSKLIDDYRLNIDVGVWEFQGKNCFCCACANAPPSYRPYIVLELIRDEEMLALREQLPQAVQAIENVVSVATADASKLVDFIANMDTTLSAAVAEASSSVNAAVQAEVDEAKALLDGVVTQGTDTYNTFVQDVDQTFADTFSVVSSIITTANGAIASAVAEARSMLATVEVTDAVDIAVLFEETKAIVEQAIEDVQAASEQATARLEELASAAVNEIGAMLHAFSMDTFCTEGNPQTAGCARDMRTFCQEVGINVIQMACVEAIEIRDGPVDTFHEGCKASVDAINSEACTDAARELCTVNVAGAGAGFVLGYTGNGYEVACFAVDAYFSAVDSTTLESHHAGCNSGNFRSNECHAATHRWCLSQGYNFGLGQRATDSQIDVACFGNHNFLFYGDVPVTASSKAKVRVLHHVKAASAIGLWEGYNDMATAGISNTDSQGMVDCALADRGLECVAVRLDGTGWHMTRNNDGSWIGANSLDFLLPAGANDFRAVSVAGDRGHIFQVMLVRTDGTVYHSEASTQTGFAPFNPVTSAAGVQNEGDVVNIDCAMSNRGLECIAIKQADFTLWHVTRFDDGSWDGFNKVDFPNSHQAQGISLAGDRTAQVQILLVKTNGDAYHAIADWEHGVWNGFNSMHFIPNSQGLANVDCGLSSNGLECIYFKPDGQTYHSTRNTTGGWNGLNVMDRVSNSNLVRSVTVAGDSSSEIHSVVSRD